MIQIKPKIQMSYFIITLICIGVVAPPPTNAKPQHQQQSAISKAWQTLYSTYTGTMSNNDIDYMTASKEEISTYLRKQGYLFENVAGNWKTDIFYKITLEKDDTIHARFLFDKKLEEFDTNHDLYIDAKIIDNNKYRKIVWFADYQESRLQGEQKTKAAVIPHRNKIILRYGQDDMLNNLGISSEMLEWAKQNPTWKDEVGKQWYCKNKSETDYGITIDSHIEIGYTTEDDKKYYLEYLFSENLLVGIGECKWK